MSFYEDRTLISVAVLACGAGVALGCAGGGAPPGDLSPGLCGIQVSADADVPIGPLSASARLIGHPDDEVVDSGFRPGGRRAFTVDCEARCVVVQGNGQARVTGRTLRYEGVADLQPGRFVRLRMTTKSGNDNPNTVARRRGCVIGL